MGIESWVIIAAISILASIFGMYFDYKKSTAKLSSKMDSIEDSAMHNELQQIKQRLAVLEKIITAKNYSLNEEFTELQNPK